MTDALNTCTSCHNTLTEMRCEACEAPLCAPCASTVQGQLACPSCVPRLAAEERVGRAEYRAER